MHDLRGESLKYLNGRDLMPELHSKTHFKATASISVGNGFDIKKGSYSSGLQGGSQTMRTLTSHSTMS
jgi:hypothetical protein